MPTQYNRKKRHNGMNKLLIAFLSIVIVLVCAFGSIVVINMFVEERPQGSYSSVDIVSNVSSEPEPIKKVSTATIAATGDLLMHSPIYNNAKVDGGYNFDNIFTYLSQYASKADYAVANLETTLRGTEDGKQYSGYPQFNCPDEIVDAVKKSGFDMLLTANNHTYDTYLKGLLRTQEVISAAGIDYLGTIKEETAKKYTVKEINGIKIGMLCYTYQTSSGNDGEVHLNGIPLNKDARGLVNAFSYSNLDKFYSEVETHISNMKNDGAEAIVLYIHWGEEYQIKENKNQNKIAQQMCNLGVDVIVGGHAHVVQPIELLTSEIDENHKTVCLYSMGNAVSNQRIARASIKTGHTEDGVLFSFTFAKYSDGTVLLESADILPTWVNLFYSNKTGKNVYQIIPLDDSIEDWKTAFDLSDANEKNARKSYDRTVKIVDEGLVQVNEYLSSIVTPDKLPIESNPSQNTSLY